MTGPTLYDLEELLEHPRNQDLSKEMMVRAADRLLHQQCLFRDDHNATGTYDLVLRHKAYFAGLFDALGRELVIRPEEMMIELRPNESLSRTMLSLDETILLLALRAAFENGVLTMSQEEFGHVETTSMEVMERYDQWVARPRPAWPRVRKILDSFRRRRFIDLGDDIPLDNGVSITIRPAIRSVTGEAWQTRIEDWIAATKARQAAEEGADPLASPSTTQAVPEEAAPEETTAEGSPSEETAS
ncbi:DUF4194 domain-containing protein [Novosphingobium profundi]|uniref:DUF4194 domain-containing protein n=1 Tax=Novosphingobium profundi TaxID=1774954 RepID=UPI001BDA846B|nr:DUF4194 domain-containing protein [Novosphingobium profundi]MBT0670520.1 DUF4194 domain-containing protein [Novosphingobium profundi]